MPTVGLVYHPVLKCAHMIAALQPLRELIQAIGGGSPWLAAALISAKSFIFDGRTVATAYEWYQKDAAGGWIWGNSTRMNDLQKATLQSAVCLRKSAFGYRMGTSWVIMAPWGHSA